MPANNTAATAIDIGTLTGYVPYTTSEDAWNGAGVDDLWYSYLPVAGDDMLEVYAYGNGTTVLTSLSIRSGPPPAATQLANNTTSTSRPVQQDIVTFVTPGERVFFQIIASNVNPALVHLRIARGQKEPITDGDLYINDSSPGYPGVVMARATAIPLRYHLDYPAGEGQQTLQNGVVGVIDAFTALGPVLYDVAADGLTVRVTPTMPDTHYVEDLSSNQIDTFVVLRTFGAGNDFAVTVDQNGVVGTPLDLGSGGYTFLTPQADLSAYYGIHSNTINKITNPGGVVSSFLTVDATFSFACNPLMLTDDTLLVGYEKLATTAYVKRFDLNANLLNTITLTGVTGVVVERLFADPLDPVYFWVWWQDSQLNHFQRYRISDGALIEDLSRMKFVESVSQTTVLANDTVFSGADFSCVPIVLRLPAIPLRLTQLPVEVAYDYAMLQPFIKGGGLNWITPPKTLT